MAQGTLNAVQTLRATIGFDVYTKAEADAKFADKDSVYTKEQSDDKFADKDNVYTKEETNGLLDDKADKATTLAGYGITDAYTKSETDSLLDGKADKSDTYTKQETNSLLDEKADKSTTYTKTEVDSALSLKANSTDVYTKTEADDLLSAKANKSTTLAGYGITDAYTKTQTDNLLNGKADADSVYTKSEIDTKIPNSVGSTTKPVYVSGGVVSACTYELNKTVPANAVFTDTTYTAGNGLNLSGTSFSAKAGTNVTVDGNGINVNGNGAVASANTGLINGGTAYTELRPTLDGTWVKNAQTTATNLQKLEGGIEYLYAILSKQYDQLKKYINGNYYDYDTDTDSKYTKTVPNGAMPYASLEQIGGKTVVWNQLADFGTITGTGANQSFSFTSGVSIVSGHKYFFKADFVSQNTPYLALFTKQNGTNIAIKNVGITTSPLIFSNTYNATSTGQIGAENGLWIYLPVSGGFASGDTVSNIMLIDLTLLYGAGNEPTTVQEFQQQFPAPYYAFNNGTLLSAGVTEVVSQGVNLWDEQWEEGGWSSTNGGSTTTGTRIRSKNYIPVMPNTNYNISFGGIPSSTKVMCWYDENKTFISGSWSSLTTNTSPSNARYLKFNTADTYGTTYNNNICVYLVSSNTNGTYYPYFNHNYPIPAEIQALEGYGWSAGSVYNYVDFERKVFVQNVARVDLGSLSWTKWTNTNQGFYASAPLAKGSANGQVANAISDKYTSTFYSNVVNANIDKCFNISLNTKLVYVYDSAYQSGDAPTFKTAMSGVYLYYELATPIETDISAYLTDDNLIEVEANGTLTFPNSNGTDYQIPIPSSETYMIDLQALL